MVVRRLRDDELQHYGVKGMKWRHHKAQTDTEDNDAKAKQKKKDKEKYNEQEKARERARSRYDKSIHDAKALRRHEIQINLRKSLAKRDAFREEGMNSAKGRAKMEAKKNAQAKEKGYKEHINERARKTVGAKTRKAYTNSSEYLKKKGQKMARKYQDMPLPKRSGN